ncbi:hypothetical protein B0188_11315 [[Haemophilus] felis]|uniref:Uncharacterized protein n=1 Tax=[Haemophilus] felis TaxID=123822 RepID=A0A1T0AS24_9PAST|nr:hypothetical protein B0188_11315 [[Haemophilus] felis]
MKDLILFFLVNALFISQGIFPFFMSLAFLMMIVFKKISEFNDVKKSMFNPLIKLNLIITILFGIYYASLL